MTNPMQPDLKILACDTERRSPGVVLLTVGRSTRAIRKTSEFEAVIAITQDGKIAWQREFDFCLMDVRRSRQDTILIMGTGGIACEIDHEGNMLHKWYCRGLHDSAPDGVLVDTLKFHHSICELEDGTLCSLSLEQKPLAEPDELADYVMLDTIFIWNRDGSVVKEMSLADVCDIERYSHDSHPIYYQNQGWPRTKDWSHGNCVIQDPKDKGFLMSFRHQDSVTKVTEDGQLQWIMGIDRGYRPQFQDKLLKMEWERPFYHQHDISFTQNGDVMIFDNGTRGAFPPDPIVAPEEQESFALCFDVDEEAMTAKETWRYGGHGVLPFSLYVSGVCEMPNGNKFIACSGLKHDKEGKVAFIPPQGVGAIELIEVTPEGERVFHARIEAPEDPIEKGWNGFRPEYVAPDLADRLAGPWLRDDS
ncbi:aryl-sulfate sulfotransferase [Cognatishimia sp. SS12]|uniref:aryl-sulfate sulfotransferase n=1 Tax=Cognatishimia sp. SS12 TaxID=2979465 RepID=UPI00233016C9|nr:aryl-sulfate sulfotransferase [Cognatishimia sp. SS12]MDC0739556.1 aryl-sulfate sulfotransferase [Cognatishimia sp. SS12]